MKRIPLRQISVGKEPRLMAERELESRRDVFTFDALAWSLAAAEKSSEAQEQMERATDAAINTLPDPNIILFSERNSEAMNAPANSTYGNITQDDYDT